MHETTRRGIEPETTGQKKMDIGEIKPTYSVKRVLKRGQKQ
jgi:hypothetical protein